MKFNLIHMTRLLCLSMLCLMMQASISFAASTCQDDARLNSLDTLLSADSAISPPLELTLQSFIQLQGNLRKKLGNNINVCPKIPLNKEGKPIIKQAVDFYLLWEKIKISVAKGDWEEIAFLQKSFIAKPLDTEAIYSLLLFPMFNENNRKQLIKLLRVQSHEDVGNKYFFVADVFKALGGKVTKAIPICFVDTHGSYLQAQTKLKATGKPGIIKIYTAKTKDFAKATLNRFGIQAIAERDFF